MAKFEFEIDCPRSGPGPELFGPGPGPGIQIWT